MADSRTEYDSEYCHIIASLSGLSHKHCLFVCFLSMALLTVVILMFQVAFIKMSAKYHTHQMLNDKRQKKKARSKGGQLTDMPEIIAL